MLSTLERVGAALGNPFPQTGAATVPGPRPKSTQRVLEARQLATWLRSHLPCFENFRLSDGVYISTNHWDNKAGGLELQGLQHSCPTKFWFKWPQWSSNSKFLITTLHSQSRSAGYMSPQAALYHSTLFLINLLQRGIWLPKSPFIRTLKCSHIPSIPEARQAGVDKRDDTLSPEAQFLVKFFYLGTFGNGNLHRFV